MKDNSKITVMTMLGAKEMTHDEYNAYMAQFGVKPTIVVPKPQPTLERATQEQQHPGQTKMKLEATHKPKTTTAKKPTKKPAAKPKKTGGSKNGKAAPNSK